MISVVVPVFDEEAALRCNLPRWLRPGSVAHEVIVVDGGSRDAGPQIAAEMGARVLHSRRGRGTQMNLGGREARGELLLFLHADCWLDEGALDRVLPIVERDGLSIMVDDDRLPLAPGETPMMKSVRFRTLGCYPLTGAIASEAATLPEVIREMLLVRTSERQGRAIDHDQIGAMEKKKQEGYF